MRPNSNISWLDNFTNVEWPFWIQLSMNGLKLEAMDITASHHVQTVACDTTYFSIFFSFSLIDFFSA